MGTTRGNKARVGAALLILICCAGIQLAHNTRQAKGNLIAPFLNGKLPNLQPVEWSAERKYPKLRWPSQSVTRILQVPNRDQHLVLGKEGRVILFDAEDSVQESKIVLDIQDQVGTTSEGGLVGLAFHPDFDLPEKDHYRHVFLYYYHEWRHESDTMGYYRLSKFRFSDNLDSIESSSERILIQHLDRDYNHIGGEVFFGNDGFLYLTLGDEGKWQDWFKNAQKINKRLYSGILRIDVDMDPERGHPIRVKSVESPIWMEGYPPDINQDYYIPNDNPWVDYDDSTLEEFFVMGLRNPYSVFYDGETEDIWVGDVGEGAWEELNIVTKGSNGQWAYREGFDKGFRNTPDTILGIETPPVHTYGRQDGKAIIAGVLYKGSIYPDLKDKFIFGDHASGNIWSFDRNAEQPVDLLTYGVPNVVDFFVDFDGSLCVLSRTDGIFRLRKNEIIQDAPSLLSEVEIFKNLETLEAIDGLIAYEVNTPLWSDGALKKRWISVPEGKSIRFSEEGAWEFPSGTVFIKHFELPVEGSEPRKIETRFFVIDAKETAYGLTYKWNDNGTDASLVGIEERPTTSLPTLLDQNTQTWTLPSRSECMECHNSNAGYVLGVKTSQLNRMNEGSSMNQIDFWFQEGLIDSITEKSDWPKLASLENEKEDIGYRIRSYLDANCSHCHQPGGANGAFDARISTSLSLQGIIDQPVEAVNSNSENAIVLPGDIDRSELWIRDNSLAENKMPPLAKDYLDQDYLDLLRIWIEELQPLPISDAHDLQDLIYPNPVQDGVFYIKNLQGLRIIDITDLSGRRVNSIQMTPLGGFYQVDSSSLTPGVYILRLVIGNRSLTRRVLIE